MKLLVVALILPAAIVLGIAAFETRIFISRHDRAGSGNRVARPHLCGAR